MTDDPAPLHLFQGYGVELEYMIVDQQTLDVRAVADEVLKAVAGEYVSDVEFETIAWSNELALHVIELKTNGPAPTLTGLASHFQQHVQKINEILQPLGCRLLPTAMHPWMDPHRELRLWPHEYSPVYEAYNRIFDCRGHGWANLQSVHLNLPFCGDNEFGQLHAAIRLLLPLLPALCASSPWADRRDTGYLDYRMHVYRGNSAKIPSIAGDIIPEPIFTRTDYEREIFARTYRDIAPYDPTGVLQQPFLNSRGAIARFERGAIEIRVVDSQESPLAETSICELIARTLQLLIDQRFQSLREQQAVAVEPLARLLQQTIRTADQAIVDDAAILASFGLDGGKNVTACELWQHIVQQIHSHFGDQALSPQCRDWFSVFQRQGPLARRIHRVVAGDPGRLRDVYEQLCDCLNHGTCFVPETAGTSL